MTGRLKKRGYDRDTIATQRAFQGVDESIRGLGTTVDAVGTTVSGIKSFNYEIVTASWAPGDPNPGLYPVAAGATQAALSGADNNLDRVNGWSVDAGELTVNFNNTITLEFVVF